MLKDKLVDGFCRLKLGICLFFRKMPSRYSTLPNCVGTIPISLVSTTKHHWAKFCTFARLLVFYRERSGSTGTVLKWVSPCVALMLIPALTPLRYSCTVLVLEYQYPCVSSSCPDVHTLILCVQRAPEFAERKQV